MPCGLGMRLRGVLFLFYNVFPTFPKIYYICVKSKTMGKIKDNSKLDKALVVKSSEGKGNPDKIVFTQVSKSELEKRRVSVYQYLL